MSPAIIELELRAHHEIFKQYFKEGRALRTETTVNDTHDFAVGRRLTAATWDALVDIGHQVNQRLLDHQLDACQCAPDATTLERVVLPSTHDGLPAPGLRFGDPRTMALLACLCSFQHLFAGLTNRSLPELIAGLIPGYGARQMTYDLRPRPENGSLASPPPVEPVGTALDALTSLARSCRGREVDTQLRGNARCVVETVGAAAIGAAGHSRLLEGDRAGGWVQPLVAGSVLSCLNAAMSASVHGQAVGRCSLPRPPENASRAATWSSRWRCRFGSAVASSPSSARAWVQTIRSCASATISTHTSLSANALNGSFGSPVSLSSRMRSSTRAR